MFFPKYWIGSNDTRFFFIASDLTEVETSSILFVNNDARVQSMATELWCLAVACQATLVQNITKPTFKKTTRNKLQKVQKTMNATT